MNAKRIPYRDEWRTDTAMKFELAEDGEHCDLTTAWPNRWDVFGFCCCIVAMAALWPWIWKWVSR